MWLRPLSYLPSNQAPELELKRTILNNRALLASALGIDLAAIHVAAAAVEGTDHHDWLLDFEKNLRDVTGIKFEQILDETVRLWVTQNGDASDTALIALEKAVNAEN